MRASRKTPAEKGLTSMPDRASELLLEHVKIYPA
jgi:hypothetical protein